MNAGIEYRHQTVFGISIIMYALRKSSLPVFTHLCRLIAEKEFALQSIPPPPSPPPSIPIFHSIPIKPVVTSTIPTGLTSPSPSCPNQRTYALDFQDHMGMTALMQACQSGATDYVRVLLQYHANGMLCNSQGENALAIALTHNHFACIELLVHHYKFMDCRSHYTRCGALFTAAQLQCPESVIFLARRPPFLQQFLNEIICSPSREVETAVEVALRKECTAANLSERHDLGMVCLRQADICLVCLSNMARGQGVPKGCTAAGLAEGSKWCIKMAKVLLQQDTLSTLDRFWDFIERLTDLQEKKYFRHAILSSSTSSSTSSSLTTSTGWNYNPDDQIMPKNQQWYPPTPRNELLASEEREVHAVFASPSAFSSVQVNPPRRVRTPNPSSKTTPISGIQSNSTVRSHSSSIASDPSLIPMPPVSTGRIDNVISSSPSSTFPSTPLPTSTSTSTSTSTTSTLPPPPTTTTTTFSSTISSTTTTGPGRSEAESKEEGWDSEESKDNSTPSSSSSSSSSSSTTTTTPVPTITAPPLMEEKQQTNSFIIPPSSSTRLLLSFIEIYILGQYNLNALLMEPTNKSEIVCERAVRFYTTHKEFLSYAHVILNNM